MSNYYTPTIEEFRVGFEYEQDYTIVKTAKDHGKNPWEKKIFKIKDYEFIECTLKSEFAKVKYLDIDDIKDKGFHLDLERAIVGGNFKGMHYSNKYYLEYMPFDVKLGFQENTKVSIYRLNEATRKKETVFEGAIKNKSEFEIVLRQLGIK